MRTEKLGAERGSGEPEGFLVLISLAGGIAISEPGRLRAGGPLAVLRLGHRRRSRNKFVSVAVVPKSKGRVRGRDESEWGGHAD